MCVCVCVCVCFKYHTKDEDNSLKSQNNTMFRCPGYDVKLHLVARYQLWSSGECGVPLHCHYSQVHSDPEW